MDLKYVELFYKDITSQKTETRSIALSLLNLMNQDLAKSLATWVAQNSRFPESIREEAKAIRNRLGGLSSYTFAPVHDAYVRLSTPTSNFATASALRGRATIDDTLKGYLKFDVAGLDGSVVSAKLRLHVTNASDDGGSVRLVSNSLLGTTTPWTQTELNWNNAPVIGGTILSSAGAVAVGNIVEFDVTPAITGNGTYSFGLKNNSRDDVHYSSKEWANPPQLVIQLKLTDKKVVLP